MTGRRIKVAVIREDLLAITGSTAKAVILKQFLYWSERIKDADVLIQRENEIATRNGEEEKEPFYGWIYKTADEMADEIMLGVSSRQVRRYIKELVADGFLTERHNPKYKWDRTLQYKVNLVNIARALNEHGYPLSDYKIELPEKPETMHLTYMSNQSDLNVDLNRSECRSNTRDYITETTYRDNFNKENNINSERVVFPEGKDNATFDYDILNRQIDKVCDGLSIPDSSREEVKSIITYYYEKYKEVIGAEHPRLKQSNVRKVVESIYYGTDAFDDCCDIEYYKPMIDKHFETQYRNCDYNICHFVSDGIINNRMYETAYR